MAVRELTMLEVSVVAGGRDGEEIVVTAPRIRQEEFGGGFGFSSGGGYTGGGGGGALAGGGGGSRPGIPVPTQPQVPLPPTTSSPEGPQFDVGSGVTIGVGSITAPYGGKEYGPRIVLKF